MVLPWGYPKFIMSIAHQSVNQSAEACGETAHAKVCTHVLQRHATRSAAVTAPHGGPCSVRSTKNPAIFERKTPATSHVSDFTLHL